MGAVSPDLSRFYPAPEMDVVIVHAKDTWTMFSCGIVPLMFETSWTVLVTAISN